MFSHNSYTNESYLTFIWQCLFQFVILQDFLLHKSQEAEAVTGSGRNYLQEYLEHHGRYGEAVDHLKDVINMLLSVWNRGYGT